jgi:hypothetical protein
MYTETMTQGLSIADVINSQSVNNASVSSLGIDMSKFKRALFIIQAASLGAAGTLDGRLQSAPASNFATVHNIAASNLTQITTATTPGNNALATIEIRADEIQAGDRYVRVNLTGGGNAITVGAIGLGGEAEPKPGNLVGDLNNTYLSQRVVV